MTVVKLGENMFSFGSRFFADVRLKSWEKNNARDVAGSAWWRNRVSLFFAYEYDSFCICVSGVRVRGLINFPFSLSHTHILILENG